MHRILAALALPLATTACLHFQDTDSGKLPNRWDIPSAPELFAPGVVSTGGSERDATWDRDHSLFAFSVLDFRRRGTIVVIPHFSDAVVASFSGVHEDIEPCFEPRGEWLWFASKRPHPDDPERTDWNLWRIHVGLMAAGISGRSNLELSAELPEDLDLEPELVRGLDGPGDEFYPSVARDGTVAFTAERDGGLGGEDIWLAHPSPDGGWTIENPGPSVNGPGPEFNAFLAPDGATLIFSSVRPEDPRDQGGGDLYVSTLEDGAWTPARPLVELNSPALDYCPSLSPEGDAIYFTSRRVIERGTPETAAELRDQLARPRNGLDDIYWCAWPVPSAARDDR